MDAVADLLLLGKMHTRQARAGLSKKPHRRYKTRGVNVAAILHHQQWMTEAGSVPGLFTLLQAFKYLYLPKTTNNVHVGDPAAGRANTTHRSHVNVASLTAKKVWAVRRCFKQCGNWWRWLGTSSPDRLFENGLFLHGGTLADRAFSTLNV